jgi:ATP-dependent Clp protease adapter protein ClpS
MNDDIDVLKPDTVLKPKIEQPRLYKVVLINDDYTPREFVVRVLKAVFRTTEDQSYRIMMTGHQRGACVRGDLHARRRREQGQGRHRDGPAEGYSAAISP